LTTLEGSRSLHLGVVHIMRPVVILSQMLAGGIDPGTAAAKQRPSVPVYVPDRKVIVGQSRSSAGMLHLPPPAPGQVRKPGERSLQAGGHEFESR